MHYFHQICIFLTRWYLVVQLLIIKQHVTVYDIVDEIGVLENFSESVDYWKPIFMTCLEGSNHPIDCGLRLVTDRTPVFN